jgi:hypothetical protein
MMQHWGHCWLVLINGIDFSVSSNAFGGDRLNQICMLPDEISFRISGAVGSAIYID